MSMKNKPVELPGHLAASAVINEIRPARNIELITIEAAYNHRPMESSPLLTASTPDSEKKLIRTNNILFCASLSAQDLISSKNSETEGLSQTYNDLILSPEYERNDMLAVAIGKYFLEYGAPSSYQEIEEIFERDEAETDIEHNSSFPENEGGIRELLTQRAILEAKNILEQNSDAVTCMFGELITKKQLNGDQIKHIMNHLSCEPRTNQENSL